MENQIVINKTVDFVKACLEGEGTGHDWEHIKRVWQLARKVGKKEKADLFIVELAALLHDIADWKFHDGDLTAGAKKSREFLSQFDLPKETIDKVCYIVEHVSFKGANTQHAELSLEGQVVQDADRLDALGAIGIARAFAYGGSKHRMLHDPSQEPTLHENFEEYKKKQGSTINHFYEKLLLLKDKMHTNSAKELADERHEFMLNYLKQFLTEWEIEA